MPCAGDDMVKHWQKDIYRIEDHIPEWKSPNREIRAQAVDDFIKQLSVETKKMLRPIAETLAMLDGNAFFGMGDRDTQEWYEQYLPEAYTLFEENGGKNGWAGKMYHVSKQKIINENKSAAELDKQLQTVLILLGEEDESTN